MVKELNGIDATTSGITNLAISSVSTDLLTRTVAHELASPCVSPMSVPSVATTDHPQSLGTASYGATTVIRRALFWPRRTFTSVGFRMISGTTTSATVLSFGVYSSSDTTTWVKESQAKNVSGLCAATYTVSNIAWESSFLVKAGYPYMVAYIITSATGYFMEDNRKYCPLSTRFPKPFLSAATTNWVANATTNWPTSGADADFNSSTNGPTMWMEMF